MGIIGMLDYGIKISRKGVDVSSATPSDLIYSSKYSNFKILGILTGTINVTSGDPDNVYTVSIDNTFGIPAIFFPFVESTTTASGKWQQATLGDATGTVFVTTDPDAYQSRCFHNSGTDKYDCSISLANITGNRTYTFKVVVFADDLVGDLGYTAPSVSDYGIKVSKEGFDVNSATDTDLSMTSKFNNLTVSKSGQVTASYPTSPLVVAHSLGYKPIFMLFVRDPDVTSKWRYVPTTVAPAAGGVLHVHSWVDGTNLYIAPPATSTPTNLVFKYLIFNERIAD